MQENVLDTRSPPTPRHLHSELDLSKIVPENVNGTRAVIHSPSGNITVSSVQCFM